MAAASGYNLDWREAAGGSWTRRLTNLNAVTAAISDINPNAGYQARVQAVNASGASAWTQSAAVFPTGLPPAVPYWVKISRASCDHVVATWRAILDADAYESSTWNAWVVGRPGPRT